MFKNINRAIILKPVSSSSHWLYLNKWCFAPLVMHNLFCFNKVCSMPFWINTYVGKRPYYPSQTSCRTATVYQQKASYPPLLSTHRKHENKLPEDGKFNIASSKV